MSNEQKLREALKLLLASGGVIAEATADELQSAIADPDADEIVKVQAAAVLNARQALATTEPAVTQQLTTEPLDEREAFEREMMQRKSWTVYAFQPHPRRGEYPHPDYLTPQANTAWAGWQARAAMAQGVKG